MTATATNVDGLLAALRSRGIELQAHGDRLRYRPKAAMTPELAKCLRVYRAELLAALSTRGTPTAAIADRLDSSDVQEGNESPAVAIRKGDERAVLHQGDGLRIADFVGVPAAEPDAERLERIAGQQLSELVGAHADSLTGRAGGRQPRLAGTQKATEGQATPPAGIPARPPDRRGYVTELVLRDGRWCWRQRRADEADRAYAGYVATRQARTAARKE